MKLTSREKTMLIILAAFVLIALSYQFMFKPQIDRLKNLRAEAAMNQNMSDSMRTELASGGQLDSQVNDLTGKLTEKTKRFYPNQLQDKLILAFDQWLANTRTVSNSYTFGPLTTTQPSAPQAAPPAQQAAAPAGTSANDLAAQYNQILNKESGQQDAQVQAAPSQVPQQPDTQVQYMNVTLSISGSYQGVLDFIKELEASTMAIRINTLNVTKDAAGMATGSISADFYTLPLIIGEGQ